jgi:hypothetical protein
MEQIIKDKQAQIAILKAIETQLCECECEHGYVKKVRIQLEKELDDIRNFKD